MTIGMTNLNVSDALGQLTEAEIDALFPPARYKNTTPACTAGACRQGRDPCPTPDACRVPEPGDRLSLLSRLYLRFVRWATS